MTSEDFSPAIITSKIAVNYGRAREVISNELHLVINNLLEERKPVDGLLADFESIMVGRKQQVIFLTGEFRELWETYVKALLDMLVDVERLNDADNILARYSNTGTGSLHPIHNFWRK